MKRGCAPHRPLLRKLPRRWRALTVNHSHSLSLALTHSHSTPLTLAHSHPPSLTPTPSHSLSLALTRLLAHYHSQPYTLTPRPHACTPPSGVFALPCLFATTRSIYNSRCPALIPSIQVHQCSRPGFLCIHKLTGLYRVPIASRLPVQERCPPRQKSRVERLKAKVEALLT